jgi:hypothetical protein
MNIYACGCSFTYGDELTHPETSAWPILLANKFKGSVVNDAVSGGTNYRTVYRTIKNLHNSYDLYLIAWTTNTRFTFYKSDNNFEINFNPQLKNNLYGKESFYRDWGEVLYKIWYNELYSFKLWLQQIVQLQAVLKNQNYLMINTMQNHLNLWLSDKPQFQYNVKKLINFDLMTDEQILDEYQEIQYYVSLIDTNKFYQWNNFAIDDLCNNFPIGPNGHILEQGHQHLAELIYNHLCSK